MTDTPKNVLILGANGRFGSHATIAFAQAGWKTHAQTRAKSKLIVTLRDFSALQHHQVDIGDLNGLSKIARRCDVIVNALNPPYGKWEIEVPNITETVLRLADASGATIMVPGNVYNFGADMPRLLTQDTPHRPTCILGKVRAEMEARYRDASTNGIKVILLRGGDFLQADNGGNWFDSHLSSGLPKGRFTYPGHTDIPHAWCYLPDFCRALVDIAERRCTLPLYSDIPYEGTTLTGQEMVEHIEKAMNRTIKITKFPWPIIWLLALLNKDMKGVLQMRYLWNTPHKIDDTYFKQLLPDFKPETTREIIANCVKRYI